MRAHSSLRLSTLHGTTPELLASPWYCAWGFCMVWEAGLPHKTSSPLTQRRNGRACSSLTARGGGLPVGVTGVLQTNPADSFGASRETPYANNELPQYVAVGNSEAVENVCFPFPPTFLETFLEKLSRDELKLRECIDFGAHLFDAIFHHSLRDQLRSLMSRSSSLRLTIATSAPE